MRKRSEMHSIEVPPGKLTNWTQLQFAKSNPARLCEHAQKHAQADKDNPASRRGGVSTRKDSPLTFTPSERSLLPCFCRHPIANHGDFFNTHAWLHHLVASGRATRNCFP